MRNKHIVVVLLIVLVCGCTSTEKIDHAVSNALIEIASKDGFKPYKGNPVITMGPEGSFDAGALGSMTIIQVKGVFHIYYEAWGVRSKKEWDAAEYETLQIGHATSTDGINWTKDPNNPVLKLGSKSEWDETGVWDPYVIYEDGLFKMWYGGGGGRKPNIGWAYAESKDGSSFTKKGLIGTNNRSEVEDVHVVHDRTEGLYYLYYWHGNEDVEHLYCVTSPTEKGFDFSESVKVDIAGDNSFWCKFGHVLKNEEGWHLFYSNYIAPHGKNSIVRYATSEDGINWQAKNKSLIYGLDADVLQVSSDLYMMAYAPENHFDKKDADIRIALYNGKLSELPGKPPQVDSIAPSSITGKSFHVDLGEEGAFNMTFQQDGEVVMRELDNNIDPWRFNGFYVQQGDSIFIQGESMMDLAGIYDGKELHLQLRGNSE